MPLLLRPTAPSPSIDELTATVTAAPLTGNVSQRSVSSAMSEQPLCRAHSRRLTRRRRSAADIDLDCDDDSCNDPEHNHLTERFSAVSRATTSKDKVEADFRDSKRSSRDTQPDDDHISSTSSFGLEENISSVLSCCCSQADGNELGITSSSVVIEDRQLAVVDKELRNLRQNLVRKLYSRLTKMSVLRRKKPSAKSTS